MSPTALIVRLDRIKADPALAIGGRGARKLIVTKIRPNEESPATQVDWVPVDRTLKCPVHVMPATEMGVFNDQAVQDRHYHKKATEIYSLVEGQMIIEIDGTDHLLYGGDMVIVRPHAVHLIKSKGHRFLCRVIAIDCLPERLSMAERPAAPENSLPR